MKIIVISIFFISSIFANKVFDITQNDYNKYLNNSEEMLKVFKSKFLEKEMIKHKNKIVKKENNKDKIDTRLVVKKHSNNNIKKDIKEKNITIVDYSKNKVIKSKVKLIKNKFYGKKEILAKLNVNNIKKSKNLKKLTTSIENILKKQNTQYNIKDIKSIIKLINFNQLSQFESELYLKQITQFIKGN